MDQHAAQSLPEHVDVLVVGAGISGIGAAHQLLVDTPGKSFVVLEARDDVGGTWDLFRYPGIRSDSDLFTFGFAFRPWRSDVAIASGEAIREYLNETVDAEGIRPHIRFRTRVERMEWSSATGRWTVHVVELGDGHGDGHGDAHGDGAGSGEAASEGPGVRRTLTASWVFAGAGYYRYDRGYVPELPGLDDFLGEIIHPQHWPEDADLGGKRVLVIGSGATAVTLVPALAGTARHVTMLQRTPSYVLPLPARDPFAGVAMRLLGEDRGFVATRYKSALVQRLTWLACQRFPKQARRVIRAIQVKQLPEGYPVDVHFNPPYQPWDQRLCVVPDGDLFAAISRGEASVVTDRIRTFTPDGVQLESGEHLDADVVVTATGLSVLPFGGIETVVDGEPFVLADHVAYRGFMLDGLPNFAFAIGYTNASWTLKVSLLCEYFTRLLRHMDARGFDQVRPQLPEGEFETRPLLDFGAGYVQRAVDDLPRQGTREPWLMSMNWFADRRLIGKAELEDGHLAFSRTRARELR